MEVLTEWRQACVWRGSADRREQSDQVVFGWPRAWAREPGGSASDVRQARPPAAELRFSGIGPPLEDPPLQNLPNSRTPVQFATLQIEPPTVSLTDNQDAALRCSQDVPAHGSHDEGGTLELQLLGRAAFAWQLAGGMVLT